MKHAIFLLQIYYLHWKNISTPSGVRSTLKTIHRNSRASYYVLRDAIGHCSCYLLAGTKKCYLSKVCTFFWNWSRLHLIGFWASCSTFFPPVHVDRSRFILPVYFKLHSHFSCRRLSCSLATHFSSSTIVFFSKIRLFFFRSVMNSRRTHTFTKKNP